MSPTLPGQQQAEPRPGRGPELEFTHLRFTLWLAALRGEQIAKARPPCCPQEESPPRHKVFP